MRKFSCLDLFSWWWKSPQVWKQLQRIKLNQTHSRDIFTRNTSIMKQKYRVVAETIENSQTVSPSPFFHISSFQPISTTFFGRTQMQLKQQFIYLLWPCLFRIRLWSKECRFMNFLFIPTNWNIIWMLPRQIHKNSFLRDGFHVLTSDGLSFIKVCGKKILKIQL